MDELLDIVDENDHVIGQEQRSQVHKKGLRHRGVHIFLFNPQGLLLVQQRSSRREASPSMLDCSVSEHVKAGENYLQAAYRGLREELGITQVELIPVTLFAMRYGLADDKISQLYKGQVLAVQDSFDREEVECLSYWELAELLEQAQDPGSALSYWFRQLILWYLGKPSAVRPLETRS
jgi:isopentenyl-diphosphate delta-isomerase type 1